MPLPSLEAPHTMDVAKHPKTYELATETVNFVRSQLPESLQHPKVAIVCGSGLGGLAETIEAEPKKELSYEVIPNFPTSTGKLVAERVLNLSC
jgi:purine-nucleoside phosphorylase